MGWGGGGKGTVLIGIQEVQNLWVPSSPRLARPDLAKTHLTGLICSAWKVKIKCTSGQYQQEGQGERDNHMEQNYIRDTVMIIIYRPLSKSSFFAGVIKTFGP